MTGNPRVSVVIPTYNRRPLLEKCLVGFEGQTFPKEMFEVIVVDDGSTDGTRGALSGAAPVFSLRYLEQDHGGAARARNRGIAEARGELVVFTDDDCIPCRDFLDRHWTAHQGRARIVGRGPVVIVRSHDKAGGMKPKLSHYSMNFFCTSNASVRKENLRQAGEFDEGFGRWEDAELGYRLRRLGLRMAFLPDAPVFHVKPAWEVSKLVQTALADGQGAARLFKRHPSIRAWFASGLHPFSIAAGKILQPFVDRKVASMPPTAVVEGLWERLIFHAHFVRGLKQGGHPDKAGFG